jgi:hypothetical protein
VVRTLERRTLLAPFMAVSDGAAAAMSPDGRVRWVDVRSGSPVVREIVGPCRFDPSRSAAVWTISPRLAVDGRGHACCVNDGDTLSPAGIYCADLRAASPQFARARFSGIPAGVGSGAGAIAMFGTDLFCTRDGGRTIAYSFRGDAEQPLTVASCSANGDAVAVTGTRSPGGVAEQTIRVARAGGALAMLPDSPRGEPYTAAVMADGSVYVLLAMRDANRLVVRDAGGAVRTSPLGMPFGRAVGGWGDRDALLVEGGVVHALGGDGTEHRRRIEGEPDPRVAVTTRVGAFLVGITREAEFVQLTTD